MIFDTIETPRLLLQKLSSEVMTTIFKENDKKEIKSILGLNDDEFEYQQNIYNKGYDSYNQSMLNFQLVEKISNKIIGNCGFHTWNSKHQRAEIGYDLRFDECKNKGYMKEALEKILEFGFVEMKLNRIEAVIDANNTPSLKLLQYFKFTREGRMRGHYLVDGIFEDSDLYSLLKVEFIK